MQTQQNIYPKKYSRQQIRKAERIMNDPKKALNLAKAFERAQLKHEQQEAEKIVNYNKKRNVFLYAGISIAALVVIFALAFIL